MIVDLPTLRLLYLDEDEASAIALARNLGEIGLDVTHLPNGNGASSFLAGQGFDVVLLGAGAETILKELASLTNAPPVICLVDSCCDSALKALQNGAYGHVTRRMDDGYPRLVAAVLARAVENTRTLNESIMARQAAHDARERADLLLNEMKHRIANSLALAVSIAHLRAGTMPQGEARQAVSDLADRISAIAQVHKGLYNSLNVGSVALDAYLGSLIRELERSYKGRKELSRISFDGLPLSVSVDQAISLGVIVSELIGNAARFAYPGRAQGLVKVIVQRLADDVDRADGADTLLIVEDEGIGLSSVLDSDESDGLGSQLIKVLAHGLNGQFELKTITEADIVVGTRAVLRFPSVLRKQANVKTI